MARDPDLEARVSQVGRSIQRAALDAGRASDSVSLIAVTKFHPLEAIVPLWDLGLHHWGENRVQELCAKAQALAEQAPDIRPLWHLIGTIQTNKVRKIPIQVHRIHSVDRMELVEALEQDARRRNWQPQILLQLNLSGEESKHGFSREELLTVWPDILRTSSLRVCGLMTMAPQEASEEELFALFNGLRELATELRTRVPGELRERFSLEELSMGMSRDYLQAIACGATWIRVGTAILGPRPNVAG